MAMRSTKLLAFAYWQVRRFFRASPFDEGYSDSKALAVLCIAQIVLILSVMSLLATSFGYTFLVPSRTSEVLFAVLLSSAVTAANYYALSYRNRWARFEAEFESYSALSRRVGSFVVASTLVLIVVAAVITKKGLNHLPR